MKTTHEILITLLRSAILRRDLPEDFSLELTAEQWHELFKLSAKQGVLAIVYDVISQLPSTSQPPRELNLRWAISVDAIEQRYYKQLDNAKELSRIWHNEGIRTLILKGFSLSRYYPTPHHRECGDFDCYLFDKYEEGNLVAEREGAKVNREWYKHSQISFRKTMTENHQYLVTTRKGNDAKSLNDTLIGLIGENLATIDDSCILIPSCEFIALFITYHSFSHFVSEGINLRHICDWIGFMNAEQENFDWSKFYALCRKYKFDRFVDAFNAIAAEHFHFEFHNPDIVTSSPYAERMLQDMIFEDAKIYNSRKGKWHKRLKLITNIYAYAWKHRDIAQSSNLRYLWDLVYGFITKRDKH